MSRSHEKLFGRQGEKKERHDDVGHYPPRTVNVMGKDYVLHADGTVYYGGRTVRKVHDSFLVEIVKRQAAKDAAEEQLEEQPEEEESDEQGRQ